MLATANGRIKNGPSQTRATVWIAFLFKKYMEFLFYLFILKSNHMSLISALQQTTLGACPPSLPPCPEDSQILQGPVFSYPIPLCNPQRHGLPRKLLAGWPRNETGCLDFPLCPLQIPQTHTQSCGRPLGGTCPPLGLHSLGTLPKFLAYSVFPLPVGFLSLGIPIPWTFLAHPQLN